jgi:hypothetical protein
MHKLTATLIKTLYGDEALAAGDQSDIYLSMLESAVHGDDVAAICTNSACETAYDYGFEPDSTAGHCENCGKNKVVSILVLEGLI